MARQIKEETKNIIAIIKAEPNKTADFYAEKAAVSTATIRHIAKYYNLPVLIEESHRLTNVEEIQRLVKEGKKQTEIAQILGISRQCLSMKIMKLRYRGLI